MTIKNSPIAVLGAGSWGTALAVHLARNNQETHLWGWKKEEVAKLKSARCNDLYLPGVAFPESLSVTDNLSEALDNVSDVLVVVPSYGFRSCLKLIAPLLIPNARVSWATKGLDSETGKLLSEVAREELGDAIHLAVLAGPSFAKEVGADLPTAVTIAATDEQFSADLSDRFTGKTFRVYRSDDLVGVQLGGVVKNVLAVAAGISDGLGYGANARAALITRGLTEMIRLGLAAGAKQNTFTGLAGVGDLVLTCTDNQSRNRRFGLALAEGQTIDEAKKTVGQVVEGARNAGEVRMMAERLNVEMPITDAVYRLLQGEINAKNAVDELLSRTPKSES